MFQKSILVAVLATISISASAGGFSISPLLVDLQTKGVKRSTSFEVNNDDDQPVKMEISASKWTQEGDKEVYADDVSELSFFPRVFTVAPNSKQVVRLSYKGESNLNIDKAYRLWFSEIKSQTNATEKDMSGIGAVVSLSYRIGAGVFVKQEGEPVETLVSSIEKSTDGKFSLKLKNTGNTHLYPTETTLNLKTNSGDVELKGPDTWHIQPAVERTFQLKDFSCSNIVSAKLIVDGEKQRTIETTVNCK